MKKVRMLTMVFTFWVLLIIMSASWLVFLLLNNIHLVFQDLIFSLVLIIACISFSLSMFFIYQIVVDVLIEIKKTREKERNIKDILEYNQVLDPPSMYT